VFGLFFLIVEMRLVSLPFLLQTIVSRLLPICQFYFIFYSTLTCILLASIAIKFQRLLFLAFNGLSD